VAIRARDLTPSAFVEINEGTPARVSSHGRSPSSIIPNGSYDPNETPHRPALILATVALSLPASADAGLFGRCRSVARSRTVTRSRTVVRGGGAAVVQQVQPAVVQQQFAVLAVQYVAPVAVQQFAVPAVRQQVSAVGVGY
jgi:hypothetical protein